MTNKHSSMKLQAKDRISALPDCLIQHILSLLPSTREAIQTSLLSKRWKNQWTHVPVLIFHNSSGMSTEKFSRFIDNTLLLHRCSKIQKFHIQQSSDDYENNVEDHNWIEKIHFAIRKYVEELILEFNWFCKGPGLSKFFYNNASFVKLHTRCCNFDSVPDWGVSWENLKELKIECCTLPDQAIENILRGSPSLESIEIINGTACRDNFLASKSLKKLSLTYGDIYVLEISCPNLEEFKLSGRFYSLSKGLKLINFPSLICATLDFDVFLILYADHHEEIEIIQHFQHVNELKFGGWFIETLSGINLRAAPSSLLLNNKCLTLDNPDFEKHYVGIALALRISHVLEKLVIKVQVDHKFRRTADLRGVNFMSKYYWNSIKEGYFNCLVSHLKIVEINGLLESDDKYYKLILNFIKFLLKNARVLENLVVILKDGGKDFVSEVSQKLENFQKGSQNATVELLCRN